MMLFNLRESGTDTLELDIFQVIGKGGFFFDAISAKQVRDRLKARQDAKTIRVTINSEGGDVFEGLSIYEQLRAHPARVEVNIQALAASIASVIAMAGDDVSIGQGGFFMMHGVLGGARGDADFLEDTAKMMRKVEETIANIYARRSKQSVDKVRTWLSRETYMTATEALANGFVDRIESASATPDAKKSTARAFAMFNSATLDGAPDALLEAIRSSREADPSTPPADPPPPEPAPEPPPAPPAPEPPTPQLRLALEQSLAAEETHMSIPKSIILALSLAEDADEAAIVAAINKNKASARAGASIEALIGASGDAAVGAVRALKEKNELNEKLADEVEKLKVVNARRDFETLRELGLKEKKLSPMQAKFYAEKFEKAVKADENGIPAGDGSDVVADLRGFLAVSHRQPASAVILQQPNPDGSPSTPQGSATHNGKAFEQMVPAERLKLKRENLDLYNTLREDAQSRNAI